MTMTQQTITYPDPTAMSKAAYQRELEKIADRLLAMLGCDRQGRPKGDVDRESLRLERRMTTHGGLCGLGRRHR